MPSYSSILESDADQTVAVTDSAGALTLPVALNSSARQTKGVTGGRATIQVRTAAILYTINGTAPTAADESTGMKLNIGDILTLTTFAEMDNLIMRRATSTNGAVFVQYERRVN